MREGKKKKKNLAQVQRIVSAVKDHVPAGKQTRVNHQQLYMPQPGFEHSSHKSH